MSTQSLFKPLQIGSVTIANRLGISATTRNRATNTVPTDLMVEFYVQRARGGAQLIVTEGVLVSRQGTEWAHAPGLWDKDSHVPAWKKIVDAVHAEGAKIYAQLWHVGRVAHPDAPEQKLAGEPVWAPSAIAARGGKFRFLEGEPGYQVPTPIENPMKIVEAFNNAAVNAKAAGFDGVELHGANGYIINQFLDSSSNQRTDKWGGSVENRSQFGLEVIKVVKEVFGDDVAIKVNPNGGYNDMGMPLEEALATYNYFLTEADKLGLSYIALARYNPYMDVEFDGKKRATQFDVLDAFAPIIKKSKLFINSGLTPEEAAGLIESGKVDGSFFGMGWITHPDFAKRVQHGKPLDNVPDFPHLQGGRGEDLRVGYIDYPEAKYD